MPREFSFLFFFSVLVEVHWERNWDQRATQMKATRTVHGGYTYIVRLNTNEQMSCLFCHGPFRKSNKLANNVGKAFVIDYFENFKGVWWHTCVILLFLFLFSNEIPTQKTGFQMGHFYPTFHWNSIVSPSQIPLWGNHQGNRLASTPSLPLVETEYSDSFLYGLN